MSKKEKVFYDKWLPLILVGLFLLASLMIYKNVIADAEGDYTPYGYFFKPDYGYSGTEGMGKFNDAFDDADEALYNATVYLGATPDTAADDEVLTGTGVGATAYGKVEDTMMDAEDFGDFTCTGSEDGCTLDVDMCTQAEHDAEDECSEISGCNPEGSAIGSVTPAAGTFTALIADEMSVGNPASGGGMTLGQDGASQASSANIYGGDEASEDGYIDIYEGGDSTEYRTRITVDNPSENKVLILTPDVPIFEATISSPGALSTEPILIGRVQNKYTVTAIYAYASSDEYTFTLQERTAAGINSNDIEPDIACSTTGTDCFYTSLTSEIDDPNLDVGDSIWIDLPTTAAGWMYVIGYGRRAK